MLLKGRESPIRIDIHDVRCRTGHAGNFPAQHGRDLYFYVFKGAILAKGKQFTASEQGLLRGGEVLGFTAISDSTLVAFLIDPQAQVSRSGTIGDTQKIPPVILFRLFNLWKGLQRKLQGTRL